MAWVQPLVRELRSHKLYGMAKKKTPQWDITSFVRMAIIRKCTNNKCWQGCGGKGTFIHCWWECKLVQSLWKSVWRFLKMLKIRTTIWPSLYSIPSYIYERNKNINLKRCTSVFVELFTISNIQNLLKYPSTDEWIKKLWCVCVHMCACLCIVVWLFVTPWTVSYQDPPSMEFSRW